MKTKRIITHCSLVVLLGLIATVSFGCMNHPNQRAENIIKEERAIGSFTKLEVGGAFTVILTQGAQEKLLVEADADEIKKIKTEVSGSTLKIYTESDWDVNFHEMTIYLTFKTLEYMDFSGAVEVKCESELSFTNLEMDVSGAAEIDLAIEANEFDAEFSGASEIDFRGKVTTGYFELSGASEFDAENLEFQDLSVEVSGASEAKVWATGNLKIDASGASSIRYKGNPKISLDESGASSVKPL
jgi:hypothetical protein